LFDKQEVLEHWLGWGGGGGLDHEYTVRKDSWKFRKKGINTHPGSVNMKSKVDGKKSRIFSIYNFGTGNWSTGTLSKKQVDNRKEKKAFWFLFFYLRSQIL
jgi:hypothetical protein